MAASKSQKSRPRLIRSRPKSANSRPGSRSWNKNKQEAENSEIVDIVRGMSISLEELPLVLQRLRDGTFWTKCPEVRGRRKGGKLKMKRFRVMAAALCAVVLYAALASRPMPMRTAARARTTAIPP